VASNYFCSRSLLDFLPILLENSLQIGGMERRGRLSHFFECRTSHAAPNSPILVASIKANSLGKSRPKEVISKNNWTGHWASHSNAMAPPQGHVRMMGVSTMLSRPRSRGLCFCPERGADREPRLEFRIKRFLLCSAVVTRAAECAASTPEAFTRAVSISPLARRELRFRPWGE
jgi:hypothetical protein